MGKKDPRVTAYIARSAPFARPILRHLRAVVHAGAPQAAETIKWGMPAFEQHGILCFIAAFREHATLHFWKGGAVVPAAARVSGAMGQFGRIGSLADLPARGVLLGYVRRAAALDAQRAQARSARPRASTTRRAAPAKPRARRAAPRRTTSPKPGTRNDRRRAAR